jgi:hypothetical protein
MTELWFREYQLASRPVSLAVDLIPGFVLGFSLEHYTSGYRPWRDVILLVGPFVITFTLFETRI